MTNPTSNFGWQMPTSTDLVTDLPADFEVFGQAVDTSLADLKGGTTGQVLAKASNTNMDFTWVAQDDSNAIQNAIVDAKGDLIAASAADTPARLAVGNNGETLVADSSTTTGLRYQGNYAAGKNKIINGDFGIWQRGTSFSPPALDSFVADRFRTYLEGSGTTRAITRQTFTPGTAPVAGYEGQYFLRYAQTVGPSAAIGNNLIWQNIEDVRTFAGQTVTFSFWAKAAATTVLDSIYAYQVFGTGGSPSSAVQTVMASSVSIGTSWTRYSYTVAIPSISGKTIGTNNDSFIGFRLNFPLGAGATFTVDTWGWQAEIGNTATAFQTATGTIQGELAACQRYYFRNTANADEILINYAFAASSGFANGQIQYPVTMRVVPTAIETSNIKFVNYAGSSFTMSSIGFNERSASAGQVYGSVSGATAGHTGKVMGSATGAYVGISAEL